MSRSAEFSEAEEGTFIKLRSCSELVDGLNEVLSTKRRTRIDRRFCKAWCGTKTRRLSAAQP